MFRLKNKWLLKNRKPNKRFFIHKNQRVKTKNFTSTIFKVVLWKKTLGIKVWLPILNLFSKRNKANRNSTKENSLMKKKEYQLWTQTCLLPHFFKTIKWVSYQWEIHKLVLVAITNLALFTTKLFVFLSMIWVSFWNCMERLGKISLDSPFFWVLLQRN